LTAAFQIIQFIIHKAFHDQCHIVCSAESVMKLTDKLQHLLHS
jgi:hypothetical protein